MLSNKTNPNENFVAIEDKRDDLSKDHRSIYWSLLFLNLVVLWAYQSLISAQNYYIKYFPNDHLDFWGTVAAGSSMFFFHIVQLYFGIYKFGFTRRVVPGFIGYIFVAIAVMSVKNKFLLIFSFAIVGALNTITESPIYGIAGLFPTGSFTQAVQVGNGLAGFLNVIANTLIRLIVYFVKSKIDEDQLSFYIFMSVLIILCIFSIYIYYRLIHISSVKQRLIEQTNSFENEKNAINNIETNVDERKISFWQITKILKVQLFVQFSILFISLLLWPGIPCGAKTTGWFDSTGKVWWCSPFVIGTFNFGDLIGRTVAVQLHKVFSSKLCLFSSLIRILFILIIFYRDKTNNIVLLVLITFLGITNGLIATITFMVRPKEIIGVYNNERAAYLMTAALYLGIACGSIVAAAFSLTHVV